MAATTETPNVLVFWGEVITLLLILIQLAQTKRKYTWL